jgi:hypothetical protein
MTIQPFLAGSQICDANGNPLSGALLTYYLTGTTTPQSVYSDRLGSAPTANPVVCDGGGFAPMHFVPETPFDVVIQTSTGSLVRAYYNLSNPSGTIADGELIIEYVMDGGGVPVAPGVRGYLVAPYAGALNAWTLLADQNCNCRLDIWKAPFANYPPTIANSIVASAPPALTADNAAQSSTLTGWTTTFSAGDILAFAVTSNDVAQRLTLSLTGTRS